MPPTVVEHVTPEEADIAHYIAGFVLKKLWERSGNAEHRRILTSFITDSSPEPDTLLAAKSHGKLTNITNEAKCMFTELEQVFRGTVVPSAVNSSINEISYVKACQCNKVIQDCNYSSTYREEHNEVKETLLFDIVSFFFNFRVYRKCRVTVDRDRANTRVSSKEKALWSKPAK